MFYVRLHTYSEEKEFHVSFFLTFTLTVGVTTPKLTP
jgi:hypothetical protein